MYTVKHRVARSRTRSLHVRSPLRLRRLLTARCLLLLLAPRTLSSEVYYILRESFNHYFRSFVVLAAIAYDVFTCTLDLLMMRER